MTDFARQLKVLFYRLLYLLVLYSISRMLLYYFNTSLFDPVGFKEWFYGLRFDLASLCIVNIPFAILSLIPGTLNRKRIVKKIGFWIFIMLNSLVILVNLIDVIYYRFTFKRTSLDVLDMFSEDKGMLGLLPTFLFDFWYIVLIFIVFIFLIRKIYFRFKLLKYYRNRHSRYFVLESLIGFLVLFFMVVGFRGGFQLRPIGVMDAATAVGSRNSSLVLNTAFSMIKSGGKQHLKKHNFFSEAQLQSIYSTTFIPEKDSTFKKYNVVILIMESLSAEHCGFLNNGTGNTPFLDSLSKLSLVFTNCFANGKKSIDGIPAVVSGFPTLLENPLVSSPYSANKMGSLADALKKLQYSTAFFHGGNNGTMGFDKYSAAVGFDHYYGRNEYGNDADYDGKWGIFDEPFFQFVGEKNKVFPKPFLDVIFSLSAHHPYTLPEKYKGKFKEGKIPIVKCIAYSDYALQQFFEKSKNEPWYANTLFIITADHTSESLNPQQKSNTKTDYHIPLLFFNPSDSTLIGVNNKICQQIDILPAILDYLNYPFEYFCFGQSPFGNHDKGFSIHYKENKYSWISNESILEFMENGSYHFVKAGKDHVKELNRCKAFVQLYNDALIENKMYIKTMK